MIELRSAMPYILTANKSNALTVSEWNIDTASKGTSFVVKKYKINRGNSSETISVLVAE